MLHNSKSHTFISGSRRLAWSQSTETTGSFADKDCAEKVLDPNIDEAIREVKEPKVLCARWAGAT